MSGHKKSLAHTLGLALRSRPARRDPDAADEPAEHRSRALTGLFLMALIGLFYVGKPVLLPLVFAFMVSFLFQPLVRRMARMGIFRPFGALIVITVVLCCAGYAGMRLATPATEWMERLPKQIERIERRLDDMQSPMKQVTEAARKVENLTTSDAGHSQVRQVEIRGPSWSSSLMTSTREIVISLTIVVIMLYFLLAYGDVFLARCVALIPGLRSELPVSDLIMGSRPQIGSEQILRELESSISTYLLTVTLINIALGVLVTGLMYWCGLPNPGLWGMFAALINFLPYIGPLICTAVIALASSITFTDPQQIMTPPLAYFAIIVIEGNFITPLILGRRLSMSPLAIFVWMIFMDALWGIAGALLAVPMLAVMKLFFDRIKPMHRVAALIEP